MTPRTHWKVTIVPPRKGTADGPFWQKRVMPPSNARDEHGEPYKEMRQSTGTTDLLEAHGSGTKQRGCVLCGARGPTWCGRYRKTKAAEVWEDDHESDHVHAALARRLGVPS